VHAQTDTKVTARLDARQITVGDQAHLFLEVQHNPASGRLEWPTILDSFDHLEVTQKDKIDTLNNGKTTTFRQRIIITGFDSGIFRVPAFHFMVVPSTGTPTDLVSDSFMLTVQTVAVDTTKGFKPIKTILIVESSWMDYIWYIVGGGVLASILIFGLIYYFKNRKPRPSKPKAPIEPLNDRMLRLLNELDAKQLWQKDMIKEYYIELTDIVRSYIEERFSTPALELTSDELLFKVERHRELQPYYETLSVLLNTADLAKFAKSKPLPQEHMDAMENAKKFITTSRPIVEPTTPTEQK
jgi:hypothetical protein